MFKQDLLDRSIQGLIEARLRNPRLKKKKKPKSIPRPASIKGLERQYFKELWPAITHLKTLTQKYLLPQIDSILTLAQTLRPTQDAFRADDYPEEVEEIVNFLKVQFLREFSEEVLSSIAVKIAQRVESFNAVQTDKIFRHMFGVEYSRFEPWLTQELKGFVKGNVKLITGIPENYFNQLEGILLRGAQSGKLSKNIATEIKSQISVTERKAALIARDQVGSFNGTLTQLRQQNVGITHYTWSTSGDERVRPEHAERDGKIFEWANPPSDGHPGMAVNCRCVGLPMLTTKS